MDALLADASALVRSYTGQNFGPATSTVTLRSQAGMILLPQRPVTGVTSVTAIGINGAPDVGIVDYWWDGLDKIRLGEGTFVINLPEIWWDEDDGYPGTYRVVYSHGAEVPPDVVMVVCGMVLRTVTAPTAVGGITSETIGPYSYRLESAGVGTMVSLSEAERKTLDRYRRTTGMISVRVG
ncbi:MULTISPECIES: hypothetical protein [Streptosporangiaceae]|uniref:hypothetical protein n=1 Tax=Streptosporangiaceae TaxID=2004 RepID=UPI0033F922BE